jgi:metal-responsive CopG/Arc/MetJ family transcriptional regulator
MRNNLQENFTIPSELIKKLNEYSKESLIPKSALIAKLLKEFFEKNNKKDAKKA